MKKRALILVVVALALAAVAWWSFARVGGEVAATEVCAAAGERRFADAIAAAAGLDDDAPLAAHECACLARALSGDAETCAGDLLKIRARIPSYVPDDELLSTLLLRRLARGDDPNAAADFAKRATQRFPASMILLDEELTVRFASEDAGAVLDDVLARHLAPPQRVLVADRALDAGDAARALAAVRDDRSVRGAFAKARALAELKKTAELGLHLDELSDRGAPAPLVAAIYGVAALPAGIALPNHPPDVALQTCTDNAATISDKDLLARCFILRIGEAVRAGRRDEATALLAAGRAAVPGFDVDESELDPRASVPRTNEAGTLSFAGAPAGTTLLLSPDTDAPIDDAYAPATPAQPVKRRVGDAPVRWVLVDANQHVLGSGAVWPVPKSPLTVDVSPTVSQPPRPLPKRAAADGRTRVFVIVLDSGDWKIVRYGMARRELPALQALIDSGAHGVLLSDPPATAAAMDKLVRPARPARRTVAGALFELGAQVASIADPPENPFEVAALFDVPSPSFFEVIGAGERSAVNLLQGGGNVSTGRYGEMVGPHGARGSLLPRAERPLRDDERKQFPLLEETDARTAKTVRIAAAQLDLVVEIARQKNVDVVMLRVDATDYAAHTSYGEMLRGGRDDGRYFLLEVYRYVDARLAELTTRIDDDDVLLVISDHGTKSAMEHDVRSLFIAAGGAIEHGRVEGDIVGIPRYVADLVGVETDWPTLGP